jgi:hypothetical protein
MCADPICTCCHRVATMEPVVQAAIASVEAETRPPLVGVPSRDQPWTQARAKLAAAVESYRSPTTEGGDDASR